ncbi:gluconolaconase [Actinocrispum wychmicini]|nr:gluconolaconase [Actinocrispum wychmicini]
MAVAPATASARTCDCADVIHGSAARLQPEGVGYDPIRDHFLVGSVTQGTVSVVQTDGTVRTLVNDPVLVTTMGMTVDAKRGRLLVVNGDVGLSSRTTPQTLNKTAGLGVYDLRTGRRLAYHDLGALDPTRQHFGNDVALTPDGTAYVTDSLSGAIYRVPLKGSPTVLMRDDRLQPVGRGNGANGIVWHPRGFLLIAQSSARALYKLSGTNLTQVTVDQPIGAPDGLLLRGHNTLEAVDNTAANRVVTLQSKDNWSTAGVTVSRPWPDPAPTTMANSRCGVYVLSGRLDTLPQGSDEFLLRRLDVDGH